ncbi:MAG: isoprenylcysteine carboxylmethyltransferase family protein [Acidobacteria bacterium]|nr:isoprenylcysteine carboxylmethyltransferase family protein [Acidobacteriota bacterium]
MALLRFLWFPALVFSLVLGWLWLDRQMGWRGIQLRGLGGFLMLVGGLIISWCSILFASIGEGTPHPFTAKTKHLVIAGPYRFVRNPMMWGVGSVLVGLALYFGSVGLWFGLAGFLLFVFLFVPGYEERDMQRRFGEEYREYCRQVPRWWPRFPRPKSH